MGLDNLEFEKRIKLDFSEPSNAEVILKPSNAFNNIPKEILKSSTVESLITQNEDLMARLKIALRRLSILESDNQKLASETKDALATEAAMADQLLIYKEKDKYWKDRLDASEKDREIILEKLNIYKDMEAKFNQELQRFQRYHDKIKTQVKPYISDLKNLLKNQEDRIRELEFQVHHFETNNLSLRKELTEGLSAYQETISQLEKRNQDLSDHFEKQNFSLQEENTNLKNSLHELEIKNIRIHSLIEENSNLENEIVQLRHHKEELKNKYEDMLLKTKENSENISSANKKLVIENQDLRQSLEQNTHQLEKIQKEFNIVSDQLATMRLMWTSKNEENEKTKKSLEALERLNLELSQKINELSRK